jgi:hypothetical protein
MVVCINFLDPIHIGKTPFDLFDREVAEGRNRVLKKVVSEGSPARFQGKHQGRWFDQSVYPYPL